MLDQFLSFLGLDPLGQKIATEVAISIIVYWWIVSQAKKETSSRELKLTDTLVNLLYPALGMLKSKGSRRMQKEVFDNEFTRLLIAQRAKSNSILVQLLMERWLEGFDTEEQLIEEINQEINFINNKIKGTLGKKSLISFLKLAASHFIMYIIFWGVFILFVYCCLMYLKHFGVSMYFVMWFVVAIPYLGIGLLLRNNKKRKIDRKNKETLESIQSPEKADLSL